MAPHSSALAWKSPWTEELRLQSMGSLGVGHDWATSLSLFTFMPWRRQWQPTPVFLPGESRGRGSVVGCRLWGRTGSDTTEVSGRRRQPCWGLENSQVEQPAGAQDRVSCWCCRFPASCASAALPSRAVYDHHLGLPHVVKILGRLHLQCVLAKGIGGSDWIQRPNKCSLFAFLVSAFPVATPGNRGVG